MLQEPLVQKRRGGSFFCEKLLFFCPINTLLPPLFLCQLSSHELPTILLSAQPTLSHSNRYFAKFTTEYPPRIIFHTRRTNTGIGDSTTPREKFQLSKTIPRVYLQKFSHPTSFWYSFVFFFPGPTVLHFWVYFGRGQGGRLGIFLVLNFFQHQRTRDSLSWVDHAPFHARTPVVKPYPNAQFFLGVYRGGEQLNVHTRNYIHIAQRRWTSRGWSCDPAEVPIYAMASLQDQRQFLGKEFHYL